MDGSRSEDLSAAGSTELEGDRERVEGSSVAAAEVEAEAISEATWIGIVWTGRGRGCLQKGTELLRRKRGSEHWIGTGTGTEMWWVVEVVEAV